MLNWQRQRPPLSCIPHHLAERVVRPAGMMKMYNICQEIERAEWGFVGCAEFAW